MRNLLNIILNLSDFHSCSLYTHTIVYDVTTWRRWLFPPIPSSPPLSNFRELYTPHFTTLRSVQYMYMQMVHTFYSNSCQTFRLLRVAYLQSFPHLADGCVTEGRWWMSFLSHQFDEYWFWGEQTNNNGARWCRVFKLIICRWRWPSIVLRTSIVEIVRGWDHYTGGGHHTTTGPGGHYHRDRWCRTGRARWGRIATAAAATAHRIAVGAVAAGRIVAPGRGHTVTVATGITAGTGWRVPSKTVKTILLLKWDKHNYDSKFRVRTTLFGFN